MFIRNLETGAVVRANVSSEGAQATGTLHDSRIAPALSGDGRYVVFVSTAPNLVPDDTNGTRADVFVRDLVDGITTRVNVSTAGVPSAGDIAPDEFEMGVGISADGRVVTSASEAADLVAGDDNGTDGDEGWDVFVHDRSTAETTRISTHPDTSFDDSVPPSISADGSFVRSCHRASNFVPGDGVDYDLFVHDRSTGVTSMVSVPAGGGLVVNDISNARISPDGNVVTFTDGYGFLVSGDTNHDEDVFAVDRRIRAVERLSVSSGGLQSNSFYGSYSPALSTDGRFLAFSSDSDNLVPGDTNNAADVFVRDRLLVTTERVSVTSDRAQAVGFDAEIYPVGSVMPAISADGRFVAFSSKAKLTPDELNDADDVFVRDRGRGDDRTGE